MAQNTTETIDLREYAEKYGLNVGFKIPPKGYVELKAVRDEYDQIVPFHLMQACLGPDAVKDERAVLTFANSEAAEVNEVVCASLSIGNAENVPLDLMIDSDFVLGNVNAENTWIHVMGRFVTPEEDPEYDEDEDEEGDYEDEEDDMSYDDEDDEDEEEGFIFEDDDDDEPMYEYTPKSKVKIEELPSDSEVEKDENSGSSSSNPKKTEETTNPPREEPAKKRAKLDDKAPKRAEKDSKVNASGKKGKETAEAKEDKNTKKNVSSKNEDKTKSTEVKASSSEKKDSTKAASAAKGSVTKKDVKQHDASKVVTDTSVAAQKVLTFVKEELKKAKEIKGTDLGSAIAKKFGTPFKKMGFEEKTLAKFLEVHAKNEIIMQNDVFKLK